MPRKLIALFSLVPLVALSGCGDGAPTAEVAEGTPVADDALSLIPL